MKFLRLIKSIPFLSTAIIIIFLGTINQKEYTKIKILLWNTPSLALGTYLSISTGTGFIFSYIITSNLAKIKKKKSQGEIKYKKDEQIKSSNESRNLREKILDENILIERDINEPPPTINASFRVIGKTNRKDRVIQDIDQSRYTNSNYADKSLYKNYSEEVEGENYANNEFDETLDDWNQDNYISW